MIDSLPIAPYGVRSEDPPPYHHTDRTYRLPYGVLKAEGNLPIADRPARRVEARTDDHLDLAVALLLYAGLWLMVLLDVSWGEIRDGARRFVRACRPTRRPDPEKEVLKVLRGRMTRHPRGLK